MAYESRETHRGRGRKSYSDRQQERAIRMAQLVAQLAQEREDWQTNNAVNTPGHFEGDPNQSASDIARFGSRGQWVPGDTSYLPMQYPSNTAAAIMAQQYGKAPHGTASDKIRPTAKDVGVADPNKTGPEDQGWDPWESAMWKKLVNTASQVPQINYEDLIKGNQQAIRQAYAPQIAGIRKQSKATKREYKADRRFMAAIADRFADKADARATQSEKTGNEQVAAIQRATDAAAAGQIHASTADATKLGRLAERLHAGQGGVDMMSMMARQGNARAEEAQQHGNLSERIANMQNNAETRRLDTNASVARLTGEQSIKDLMDQKNAILLNNRTNINTLRGQRGKELSDIYTNLSVKQAEDQVAAESQVRDNLQWLFQTRMAGYQADEDYNLKIAQLKASMQPDPKDQFAGYPDTWKDPLTIAGNTWGQGSQKYSDVSDMLTMLGIKGIGVGESYPEKVKGVKTGDTTQYTPTKIGQILYKTAIKKYGWSPAQAKYLLAIGQTQ